MANSMRSHRCQKGQALVEMLILSGALLTVLLASLPQLKDALTKQQMYLDSARARLWQPIPLSTDKSAELSASKDYLLASSIRGVINPLTRLTSLQLPFENLYSSTIGPPDSDVKFVRLADDWSANRSLALVDEPAKLIPLGYLNNLGIRKVQNVAGWLPNTRELAADQLRLGFVNDQVVPQHALCQERYSCR